MAIVQRRVRVGLLGVGVLPVRAVPHVHLAVEVSACARGRDPLELRKTLFGSVDLIGHGELVDPCRARVVQVDAVIVSPLRGDAHRCGVPPVAVLARIRCDGVGDLLPLVHLSRHLDGLVVHGDRLHIPGLLDGELDCRRLIVGARGDELDERVGSRFEHLDAMGLTARGPRLDHVAVLIDDGELRSRKLLLVGDVALRDIDLRDVVLDGDRGMLCSVHRAVIRDMELDDRVVHQIPRRGLDLAQAVGARLQVPEPYPPLLVGRVALRFPVLPLLTGAGVLLHALQLEDGAGNRDPLCPEPGLLDIDPRRFVARFDTRLHHGRLPVLVGKGERPRRGIEHVAGGRFGLHEGV